MYVTATNEWQTEKSSREGRRYHPDMCLLVVEIPRDRRNNIDKGLFQTMGSLESQVKGLQQPCDGKDKGSTTRGDA